MSKSKRGSRPATRQSRRLALAVALAIVPAYAFGQELPVLPSLPALPPLSQLNAAVGDAGTCNAIPSGMHAAPLPSPYPFADTTPVAQASVVVRILGLSRAAAKAQAPMLQGELPQQELSVPVLPVLTELASDTPSRSLDLPAPLAEPVLSPSSEVRLASAEAMVGEAADETSFSLSDETDTSTWPTAQPVVPRGAPQAPMSLVSAVEDALALVANAPSLPQTQPELPPLGSKDEAKLPSTVASAPSVAASTARPIGLQSPSTMREAPRHATKNAVIEAPSRPLSLDVGSELDQPVTELDMRLAEDSPALPSSTSGLQQAMEFSLSDSGSDAKGQPAELALSDTGLKLPDLAAVPDSRLQVPGPPQVPNPSALRRSSLVNDGLRLSKVPETARPMRASVEGESGGREKQVTPVREPAQPLQIMPSPFRLAGNRTAVEMEDEALGKGELISSSTPRPNSTQRSYVTSVEGNSSQPSLAIEVDAPGLSKSEKPKLAVTGEMREGAAMAVDLEGASICQADGPIAELSVEHSHICRVIQTGPSNYSVVGLEPGTTRIAVITRSGSGKHDVTISPVTVEGSGSSGSGKVYDLVRELNKSITQLYPQYVIDVDVVGKSLMVQGEVGSEAEAKRVISLIRKASLMPVIDKLKSPEQ